MQLSRRDDDQVAVPEVAACLTEQCPVELVGQLPEPVVHHGVIRRHGRPVRGAAQRRPGELDGARGFLRRAHRVSPDPSVPAHQRVQLAVHVEQFEQPVAAKLAEQPADIERPVAHQPALAGRGAPGTGAHRPGAHRAFESLSFMLKRGGRPSEVAGLRQPAGQVAERGQIRLQQFIVGRANRGNRQRDGPPALAPFEHQPWPAEPDRVPLPERGKLSAVRRGLRAQLRRSEHGAELVDDRQAPAAGVHEAPRIAGRLGAARLRQPGDRPGERRAVAPSGRRGGKVLVGLGEEPPGAARPRVGARALIRRDGRGDGGGDAAGGQPRERQVGRAEAGQLADAPPRVPEQG